MIYLSDLHTMTERVNYLLASNPADRDSDNALYADYILTFRPDLIGITLIKAFNDCDLPSYESIGRARRKLQSQHPELRGSKEAQSVRAIEEEVYRAYANEE